MCVVLAVDDVDLLLLFRRATKRLEDFDIASMRLSRPMRASNS